MPCTEEEIRSLSGIARDLRLTMIDVMAWSGGSPSIVRNGHKRNGSQNYRCKNCGRQFIGDYQKIYRGSLSWIPAAVKIMMVRGNGVRDIGAILHISLRKVLQVLSSACYQIKPKNNQYDCLEIDEFWTYM